MERLGVGQSHPPVSTRHTSKLIVLAEFSATSSPISHAVLATE